MIRILEREDTVEEEICWNYLREFLRTEEYEFPLEKKNYGKDENSLTLDIS